MADAKVGVNDAGTGGGTAQVDTETLTTGAGTVNRQVVAIGDPATAGQRLGIDVNGYLTANTGGSVDDTGTGTISAADVVVGTPDANGTLLTGTPTANSALTLAVFNTGDSQLVIQLTGTFGGTTIWFEGSMDSTTGTDGSWTTLPTRQWGNVSPGVVLSATAAGVFRTNLAGLTYIRVRAKGGAGISVTVKFRAATAMRSDHLEGLPSTSGSLGVTTNPTAATAAITSVAAATSDTSLLAANTNRLGFGVYNDSATATLYLAMASAVTTSSFTVQVPPGGYYEMSFSMRWTGAVRGVWSAASGNARITEWTA